jgi:hypothetical protein
MLTGSYLYCGLSWSEAGQWSYEAISAGGTVVRWAGSGTRLAFRLVDESRHCLGYFMFENLTGSRVPCPNRAEVKTGKQCDRCRYLEGFSTVHQHNGPIDHLPAQIQDYIAQPHLLYIACFGAGQSKVGTAALSRRNARLYEQGAILARIIAHSPDGLHVRQLERAVAASGLKQSMNSSAKTTLLTGTLDGWSPLEASLVSAAASATENLPEGSAILDQSWTGGEWFYNRLLECGQYLKTAPSVNHNEFVLDATDALGHTLLCRDGDGSPDLLLVNDSRFVGRRIELDETIENRPSSVQTSLF